MPFKGSSGSKFFNPGNIGTCVIEFVGVEDGPTWKRNRDIVNEDGSKTQEPYESESMDWKFKVSKTTGEPIIDPNTGEQGVASGNTGQYLTWSGRGREPKARVWARALATSAGIAYEDSLVDTDEKANAFMTSLIGTKALGTFGPSPESKRAGTLNEINPLVSVTI